MANHSYVTTKKWMSVERVNDDLVDIMERRFKNIMKVDGPQDYEGILGSWLMKPDIESEIHHLIGEAASLHWAFSVWLVTRRQLEFRHPHNELSWWAQNEIKIEFCHKYDGKIYDTGIDKKWKPDPPPLHASYRSWIESKWTKPFNPDGLPSDWTEERYKEVMKYFMNKEIQELPEELKGI